MKPDTHHLQTLGLYVDWLLRSCHPSRFFIVQVADIFRRRTAMRRSIAHALAVGIAACMLVLSLNLLAPEYHYHPFKVTHSTRRAFQDVPVALAARSDWRVHSTLGKRDALRCDNGECNDGSCCGKNHTCGYGPDFCGDGCISKCEATAMCGEYSENADMDCGMMLCCSAMGWCGVSPPPTSPRLRSQEHEICASL